MNNETLTTKGTKNTNEKILYKDECYEIQGAIFDVYREMGCGFLESVYQECLEKELRKRGIPFVAPEHKAQVINYLKATGIKLGLLVNFGTYPKATITRLAL